MLVATVGVAVVFVPAARLRRDWLVPSARALVNSETSKLPPEPIMILVELAIDPLPDNWSVPARIVVSPE